MLFTIVSHKIFITINYLKLHTRERVTGNFSFNCFVTINTSKTSFRQFIIIETFIINTYFNGHELALGMFYAQSKSKLQFCHLHITL